MITNFETITHELIDKEKEILPFLIKGFKTHTQTNPIKAPVIVNQMNKFLLANGYEIKLTEPRLRKMVNYIRVNSLLPLIATSDGYFITNEKEILLSQIKSLNERASSIKDCANGLLKFLPKNDIAELFPVSNGSNLKGATL